MGIRKTVSLTWDGQSHDVALTMDQIDIMDNKFNLIKTLNEFLSGDVKFTIAAKILTTVLNFSGASVKYDDVWYGMFGEEIETNPDDVVAMVTTVLNACFYRSKKNTTDQSSK